MTLPKDILAQVQKLVLDLASVNRYTYIPKTDRLENVAEHSLSLAVISWRLHEALGLSLDMAKVLKYAVIHDALERGLTKDINTYASVEERKLKKEREYKELEKIKLEFVDFTDMTNALQDYEDRADDEALFVWSIDKMLPSIISEMDDWRPYRNYSVTYAAYCAKQEEFIQKCSPHLKEMFQQMYEYWKTVYYDRPLT